MKANQISWSERVLYFFFTIM